MPEDQDDDIDWSLTTWEGSRREQLRRWANLTFDEILFAQEEMADLAQQFREQSALDAQEPFPFQGKSSHRSVAKNPDNQSEPLRKTLS